MNEFTLPEDRGDAGAIVLSFEEPYEGAQIRMRSNLSVADILRIQKLQETNEIESLVGFLQKNIIEWNLKGRELSFEGIAELPLQFLVAAIRAYVTTLVGVSVPLGVQLSDGDTSEALKELMSQLNA